MSSHRYEIIQKLRPRCSKISPHFNESNRCVLQKARCEVIEKSEEGEKHDLIDDKTV